MKTGRSKRCSVHPARRTESPWASPQALADRVLGSVSSHGVVFLDVFDTVLYRCCLPHTVVERSCAFLAGRANAASGPGRELAVQDVIRRREIVAKRLMASAEKQGFDHEWRLREGLAHLFSELGMPADPESVEEAARHEIHLEKIALFPAPHAFSLMSRLNDAGLRLYFLSDMYLSNEDVASLLEVHGLGRYFQGGFVSSGPLLGKYSGRLFLHAAEMLGVSVREAVHVGNHWKSDFRSPRRLGMRAVLLLDRDEMRRSALLRLASSGMGLDPDRRALYRHLARPSSAIRETTPKSHEEVLFGIGRHIVAPVAGHLALHVLERHLENPFNRILFMAREGRTLWAAANRLAKALELPMDRSLLQYTLLSRAVTRLPSADPANPLASGTWSFGTKSRIYSARDFLKQFLLSDELIDRFLGPEPGGATRGPSLEEARARIESLGHETEFLDAVRAEQRRQQTLLETYLRQIGFLGESESSRDGDPRRVAVVDIGWAGSTQDALADLYPPSRGPRIHGYYLGLTQRGKASSRESRKEGFIIDHWNNGPSTVGVQLTAGAIRLCELLFKAHHGTVTGYRFVGTDRVEPILGPSVHPDGPDASRWSRMVWSGFLQGLDDMVRTLRLEIARPLSSRAFTRFVMHRFLSYPTRKEAAALLDIPYVQDAGQGATESIGLQGLANGTAWIPGLLSSKGLWMIQAHFDLLCHGYEGYRFLRRLRKG